MSLITKQIFLFMVFIVIFLGFKTIYYSINEIPSPYQDSSDVQGRKTKSDSSISQDPLVKAQRRGKYISDCKKSESIYGLYHGEPIRKVLRQTFPGQAAAAGRADLFRLFEYSRSRECNVLNKIGSEPAHVASEDDRDVVFNALRELMKLKLIRDEEEKFFRQVDEHSRAIGNSGIKYVQKSINEEAAELFGIRFDEYWITGSALPLRIVFTDSKLMAGFFREMESEYSQRTGMPVRLESPPIDLSPADSSWIRALGVEIKLPHNKRTGWGAVLVEQYQLIKKTERLSGKWDREKVILNLNEHSKFKDRVDDYLHALLAIPVLRGNGDLSFPIDKDGDCYLLPILVADLMQINSKQSSNFAMLLDPSKPVPIEAFKEQDLRSVAMILLGNRHDFDTLIDYCYVGKERSFGKRAGEMLQQFEERTDKDPR